LHLEAGVDEATWTRGRGRGPRFGLGAMYVHRVTNPVLAAAGRRSVTEVLSDVH
jgi:hypothetical protein